MHIKGKLPLIFGIPLDRFFDGWKAKEVFVAEIRPGLEGIKVVAEQALKNGIRPVILCDNMLAFCMERGLVSDVHIFYQSLRGKNALCRTGSLIAAICAQKHDIPVYLYKGLSQRPHVSSLLKIDGKTVTSQGLKTYVPLAEEVPLDLVSEMAK